MNARKQLLLEVLALAALGFCGVWILDSKLYLVFLFLVGFRRKFTGDPSKVLFLLSVLFCVVFYLSITGCLCLAGQGSVEVVRISFLIYSVTGLAVMAVKIRRGVVAAPLNSLPMALVLLGPLLSAMVVKACAKAYNLHVCLYFL